MKKVIIILSLAFVSLGFAQVTDTGDKVGIGTNSPAAKLHVFESIGLGITSGNYQLLSRISGSGTINRIMENKWLLRDDNGDSWLTTRFHNGLSVDGSFLTPGVNTKTWWERDPLSGNQFWGNAADIQMSLVSGNLGIGSTNPSKKLDVNGDIRIRGDLATLNFQRTTNAGDIAYIQYDHNNLSFNIVTSGKTMRFINKSNWGESMRLTPYGDLGIGTTNPDAKLTVAGKIHAQEVKVTVNAGADFVFEGDYKLPNLKETEVFIKKNKHLPEIASEKDMQENGIHLADMNIKLLQKIEELTLYTINQEKRIEVLESKNDKLLELVEKLLENTNEK